jgi:hypothetical protein
MPSQSEAKYPRHARKIEAAPGVHVLPMDVRKIPGIVASVAKRRRVKFLDVPGQPEGYAFTYHERVHDAWLRITEAAKLPLGLSEQVIHTLVRAEFVQGHRAAPNNCAVNVVSLLAHIQTTAEDPYFWTKERLQRYKDWVPKYPCRKRREEARKITPQKPQEVGA